MKTTELTIAISFNGEEYEMEYTTGNDFEESVIDFINEKIEEINEDTEEMDEDGDKVTIDEITDIKDIAWSVADWGEVDEYENLQDIEVLNEIANENVDNDWDVISAGIDAGIQISNIDEAYQGQYKDDADFAENICTEVGDIPSNLPSYIYIDWERTANDIMMDYSESDGYYFRRL